MGTRGRKSAASLSAVPAGATLRQRPKPWPGLSLRERELWEIVVKSQPVDWFGPADQPVLMAYVRTIALHERVSIESFGAPFIVRSTQGGEIANPIFKIQNTAANTMAALAVKLRLVQSSRLTHKSSTAKARSAGNDQDSGKPWEKVA